VKVPLLDLKAQYRPIRTEIMAAVESVCDDQAFILGARVADLEKDIQGYVGAGHAVGVASGPMQSYCRSWPAAWVPETKW
jgi:dTDP-4-amino-4,6-dideoxygalactose transaminase